eukprot:32078-Eustigmatos_ZCMA.PRE.1
MVGRRSPGTRAQPLNLISAASKSSLHYLGPVACLNTTLWMAGPSLTGRGIAAAASRGLW